MIRKIKKLIWQWQGSKVIKYKGFHCGCCGKYIREAFEVPTYLSNGENADTWGLCNECAKG